MSETKNITTQQLVFMALMAAMQIVLSRFLSISAWNLRIGFAFVPIVLTAILLGPWKAGIVATIADFIGAILFPIARYFPGFTFTAFLVGVTYGLFLYKKQNMIRIFGAVLVTEIVGSLLLNTLWISIMYGSPYLPLMATRVFQCIGMGVVEILLIRLLVTLVPHLHLKIAQ